MNNQGKGVLAMPKYQTCTYSQWKKIPCKNCSRGALFTVPRIIASGETFVQNQLLDKIENHCWSLKLSINGGILRNNSKKEASRLNITAYIRTGYTELPQLNQSAQRWPIVTRRHRWDKNCWQLLVLTSWKPQKRVFACVDILFWYRNPRIELSRNRIR